MNIDELIEKIRNTPDCVVYPAKGLPKFENKSHRLSEDLKEFYSICGGVSLFISKEYSIKIVAPSEFVLANPIIIGELCEEDITSEWYIVADDENGNYLTIDLSPHRLGRCYDSFWDRHGLVGECPIIAKSFTQLLENLFYNQGEYWYWYKKDFVSLGDAYD